MAEVADAEVVFFLLDRSAEKLEKIRSLNVDRNWSFRTLVSVANRTKPHANRRSCHMDSPSAAARIDFSIRYAGKSCGMCSLLWAVV